jgi:hypothetical protein
MQKRSGISFLKIVFRIYTDFVKYKKVVGEEEADREFTVIDIGKQQEQIIFTLATCKNSSR